MKTIAFYNKKCGVGKTSSAMAFAQILHDDYNKKVLFLDLDQQANGSSLFGCYNPNDMTTADLLMAPSKDKIITQVIKHSQFGVDVVPASKNLEVAELKVKLDMSRPQHNRLKNQLSAVKNQYDYCIIDCPINVPVILMNVFTVADEILVPVTADKSAIDGLSDTIEKIENAKEEYNDNLEFKGCFVIMANPQTNLHKQITEILKSVCGPKFFTNYTRYSVKVRESSYKCPLTVYRPAKNIAEDYRKIVNEYLYL